MVARFCLSSDRDSDRTVGAPLERNHPHSQAAVLMPPLPRIALNFQVTKE
jgi:hypothetical protein